MIWIESELTSGDGIDELRTSGLYTVYIQTLESMVFSHSPKVLLPAVSDLKFLMTLVVVPEMMYSTAGLEFDISDINISRRSLRLLRLIHKAVIRSDQPDDLRKQFYSAFIPPVEGTTDTEQTVAFRSSRRRNQKDSAFNEVEYFNNLLGEMGHEEDSIQLSNDGKQVESSQDVIDLSISDDEEKEEDGDAPVNTTHDDDDLRPSSSSESDSDSINDDYNNSTPTTRSNDSAALNRKTTFHKDEYGPLLPDQTEIPEDLFSNSDSIWNMVGWAFICSSVPHERFVRSWVQWRGLLEFLLEVLEENLSFYTDSCCILKQWRNCSTEIEMVTATMTHLREGDLKLEYNPVFTQENHLLQTLEELSSQKIDGARYDERAAELRARFLDLLFKTTDSPEDLYSTCRTYVTLDWSYRALIGHGPTDPHTLSRLAWSQVLQGKEKGRKLALKYLLTDSQPDIETLVSALHAVPGRNNDFNRINAPDLYKIVFDILARFLSSHGQKNITNQLNKIRESYKAGAADRMAWFRKNFLSSDKILIQAKKLEDNLEKFVNALSHDKRR